MLRLFLLNFLLSFSALNFAESLTFDAALTAASNKAPSLRAARAQIDAAEFATQPAGELPDPKLVLGVDNLPVNGNDQYSTTRDFMTMQRIGVMQQFPNQAKRDARIAAAKARVDLMQANRQVTRQMILEATALAWIARHTVEQQLRLIDELLAENQLFGTAINAQLAAGKSTAVDALMPQEEAALIETQRDDLIAHRSQAIAQLQRWIGAAAELPLAGNSPEWALNYQGLTHQLHQHPEVTIFDPRARVLDAEIDEARAAKKPDWDVEFAWLERGSRYSDMIMFEVRVDLPLFTATRQNPSIAAKRAERFAVDAERDASVREHTAMLDSEFADYQRLQRADQRFQTVLLPLANDKVSLTLAAWKSGKGALSDVVAARRARIATRLNSLAVIGEYQQMAARLHFSYGDINNNLSGVEL
jgi:cobalt-zinc-cadmium efflux system outer membrane protein